MRIIPRTPFSKCVVTALTLYAMLFIVVATGGVINVLILILISVLALAEEIIFRGYVAHRLLKKQRPLIQATASAAIFALMHWGWQDFSWHFFGGLLLFIAYRVTGEISFSALLHAALNTVFEIERFSSIPVLDRLNSIEDGYLIAKGVVVVLLLLAFSISVVLIMLGRMELRDVAIDFDDFKYR